jgi:hypothetical protein
MLKHIGGRRFQRVGSIAMPVVLIASSLGLATLIAGQSSPAQLQRFNVPTTSTTTTTNTTSSGPNAARPTTPTGATPTAAKAATATTKAGASTVSSGAGGRIGIFATSSPSDPSSLGVLDTLKGLGFDTVFNYTPLDGDPAQVTAYLNHAQALGLQIVFSLKDCYDQLSGLCADSSYGGSNEAIALNAARQFGSHPAVWGFAITDERPESASDLPAWAPILTDRYRKLKSITTKPVMAVLVGWSDGRPDVRRSLLRGVAPASDVLAMDYYPIPFLSAANVAAIGDDLTAVGETNSWFIEQCFSWSSYADTARGLGFNPGAARFPTTDEMVSMGQTAKAHGMRNILFYSYFDTKSSPGQIQNLRAAVARLR